MTRKAPSSFPAGEHGAAPVLRVGLISDTHDLLRPEAMELLRGSDHIIHAGDLCSPRILEELEGLAPVTAVRGNNDRGAWAKRLRETELIQLGEVFVYAIHDAAQLDARSSVPRACTSSCPATRTSRASSGATAFSL